MAIHFYNTLTRARELFEPLEPGKIRMYTCGPTVYNFPHIGNFRAFLFEDLLRRHLKYRGYTVTQVMNLTDIDDKIIRMCRETGESLQSLTGRYKAAFFEDLDTLGGERAEHYPAATDHIPEIVTLIKTLRQKGHTYDADGSVYFRLNTFPGYGKLSHFDIDQLKTGASGRVADDEYATEDARDFALWKAYVEDDGEIFWETELGKGRPGWHIECSSMSMKYLGESFDIHCGGIDNMFPHHENEIAQSEAATGRPFVKYWLHSAHLFVDGRKMAKSLGNFYTLRDLLEKGHDPVAIRWVLIATHYRQPNNFTFDALEAATQSVRRIKDFRLRLKAITGTGSGLDQEIAACEKTFGDSLDDDLNISGALAAVFDFVRDVNRLVDRNEVGIDGARGATALLDRLHAVTGVFPSGETDQAPQAILDLVLERQRARREKNFSRADEIRDILAQDGWVVEDTPDGPRVKRN
ncbi:MAG: cysteine--tRNA ligase [Candidatus Hydrogenedentes bacterium]|nr:cysteine--tRNA ligase [Candidatus Hydrogenedentota bacterium]